ncbi:MAG: hypothetical protein ACR2MN_11745 [Acidimicrobiales bacterium]
MLAELRHAGPVVAFARAAARTAAVGEVISLNSLLLTHEAVYAFACYGEEVIAAQDGDVDSNVLGFRPGPAEVIVASSGWEQSTPRWEMVGNGTILEVRRGSLETILHRNQWPARTLAGAADPPRAPEGGPTFRAPAGAPRTG